MMVSFEVGETRRYITSIQLTEFDMKSNCKTHFTYYERLLFICACTALINKYNSNPMYTFKLGHNSFSDLSQDEFAAYYKLGPYSPGVPTTSTMKAPPSLDEFDIATTARRALHDQVSLPDYVNWVQMGGVTPVKNQGSCGSCWAFSTTGALEGARFVKTGELVALSEQNLLDCDHVDLACNGGLMDNAFKFDEKSGGLCSEEDYPYEAKRNTVCNPSNCTDVPGSIVSTFIDVPPGDVNALISAIAMQPISIAIEASQFVFQFYKTGVINDDNCGSRGSIDHGVLAVGYGTDLDSEEPYFLVKNSWGLAWGADGYVKLGRKSKNEFGICSVLKLASFPVVV
jgi:Papain family cysteine protease